MLKRANRRKIGPEKKLGPDKMKKYLFAAACAAAVAAVAIKVYFDRETALEAALLQRILELKPGMTVADVGAGKGALSLAMAKAVGPNGRVLATEVDPGRIADMQAEIGRLNLKNVTVIKSSPRDTGLPGNCCDAILLRGVYHHLSDPVSFDESLFKSLRPGGKLAIVDFTPKLLLWPWRPKDVPANRGGHGIPQSVLVDELTAADFQVVHIYNDWPGWKYCVLFRKASQTLLTMAHDAE